MKTGLLTTLIAAGVIVLSCGDGQRGEAQLGQHPGSFRGEITKAVALDYLLFLPQDYGREPEKKWPLMLFLHGADERGDSLERIKQHGPPKIVEQQPDFPFIVVSPQCPVGLWWPEKLDDLSALLDEVEATYTVDSRRIYLTGLSMGGYGTWSLALAQPERFAAIAPICGGGKPYLARRLKNLPVWVFHGAKDPLVLPEESEKMVAAIKRAGGSPRLTIYPDADHDSWTRTYDNPELYEWLLSNVR
ncbi:hypothetical protein ES703_92372 [subsurface metagenome]